jgi:hypothetical protein
VAKLGHGGKAYLARLFGCDPDTIAAGSRDVENLPSDAAAGRVQKKGGRKKASASLQLRIRVGENRRIWEPSGNKEVSHEQEVYCTPHG